jgi:hypothetical protein
MRLAFLTSLVPTDRPDTGFEIANASALGSLKDAGCDVTVFGFRRRDDRPALDHDIVVLGAIDIETAKSPPATKARWVLASLASGLPLSVVKLRIQSEDQLLAAIRRRGPFDGLVVNTAMMAGAFPGLLRAFPAVVVAHNAEHLSAAENAVHASGLKRFAYARESRLLRRVEDKAFAAARHVLFLSEDDRAIFSKVPRDRSGMLALAPPEQPEAGPVAHDIGLIGTWTWQPNRVGLDWFLTEVAPRLPPQLRVAIAGRTPRDLAATTPSVQLLGRVADAGAFVAQSRVMALTSRIGTGVQLKALEALASGVPAVATTSSLRGIAERPPHVIIADEPAAFAQALMTLCERAITGALPRGDGRAFLQAQRRAALEALGPALASLASR